MHQPDRGLIIAPGSVVAHGMVSLAWLLENRRRMAADQKDGFLDGSPMVARIANTWVAGKLGGLGTAFASDPLVKNDLGTVWDDRVLNRACQVFGGAPRVRIEAANGMIHEGLRKCLGEMTAL